MLRLCRVLCRLSCAVIVVLFGAHALAGPSSVPPDYGYQWSTIGSPGNRGILPGEAPPNVGLGVGTVSYEYRLARTELTNGQWLEFVRAYGPYFLQDHPVGGGGPLFGFMGDGIEYLGQGFDLKAGVDPRSPAKDFGWRYAARYCNWLCNGKRSDRAAFENGAYDTSTFTTNPDGSVNDQLTHTPGAAFWIPTTTEWFKAAFFDPTKIGPDGNAGAYRQFVGASDISAPVAGAPETGGQTNCGQSGPFLVGSYPTVTLPWDLLDMSGGVSEMTEGTILGVGPRVRLSRGSNFWGPAVSFTRDRIGFTSGPDVDPNNGSSRVGLRLASDVPASGVALILPLGAAWSARRLRHETPQSCTHTGPASGRRM